MARDDDQESGKLPRTSRAIRLLGHPASGGHGKSVAKVRNSVAAQRKAWDAFDPDDDDTGGDMPQQPYSFQEYPKHVYPWPDEPKRFVQVNSRAEEDEAMAQGSVTRPGEERKRLLAIAKNMGLEVDGRWALDKIEVAIKSAGGDPSANPFA